ncbi:MAG: dTDP-4-amino-4,6-dideoxygalactose transaminase [Bacteroidota bacterium]
MIDIPFNKPFLTGKEFQYMQQAINSGKISGNGIFTKKCQDFFQENYGFKKCLMTTSCTDALEMAAILLDIKPGDEIILPSFTFVSTANAFVLRGARMVFADSYLDHPNIDPSKLEALISPKTKAIVLVHYAGMACDMDPILAIAEKYNLYIVEDAAMAIDSFYKGKPLGGIGHMGTFSFHETKNIISGEGGMLIINDEEFFSRADIIWEKGTNRKAFFQGEVDKYNWIDVGSSFLPSEIISSFLYAQLENLSRIQNTRKRLWKRYYDSFQKLQKEGKLELPCIPDYATNNAHLFYVVCESLDMRTSLLEHLQKNGILAIFHYLPLHKSPFILSRQEEQFLPNCDKFSDCVLRLPLFFELKDEEQDYIIELVHSFFAS